MSYKRDDKDFKATLAARADELVACDNLSHPSKIHRKDDACYKPFPKHEDKIVTATIDENGDVLFLATHANDALFLNQGSVVTKRASHVEPYHLGYRIAFHILRWFGDKTQIAEWTRNWPVVWRVNTKPVGGPVLTWGHLPHNQGGGIGWGQNEIAVWRDRQEAIDAEVKFLNTWFLERGIR